MNELANTEYSLGKGTVTHTAQCTSKKERKKQNWQLSFGL